MKTGYVLSLYMKSEFTGWTFECKKITRDQLRLQLPVLKRQRAAGTVRAIDLRSVM